MPRSIAPWAFFLIAISLILIPVSANTFSGWTNQTISVAETATQNLDASYTLTANSDFIIYISDISKIPIQYTLFGMAKWHPQYAEFSDIPSYLSFTRDITNSVGADMGDITYRIFKESDASDLKSGYANLNVILYLNWDTAPSTTGRYYISGGYRDVYNDYPQLPSVWVAWVKGNSWGTSAYLTGGSSTYYNIGRTGEGQTKVFYDQSFSNYYNVEANEYETIVTITRPSTGYTCSGIRAYSNGILFYESAKVSSSASTYNFPTSVSSIELVPKNSVFSTVEIYAYSPAPTPTPTQNPENDLFTLSLSSTTAAVGDPITAALSPAADAPRYSEVAWTVSDPDGNADIELYTKPSPDYTSWTHYNKTSRTFEASTESAAHNLTFTPTGPGTWTISAVVRDQQPPSTGATLASVSASCQVERKAGNIDVVISTYDGAYSSAHYLTGVGLTVWDLSRNATVIYDSTGSYILGSSGTYNGLVTVSAPLGDEIRIRAEKSGYITSDFNTFVQPTALPLNQMPISITLMPAATPAPDQVYASFTVRSAMGSPIPSAAVVAGGHLGSTDQNGYARIAIPYNETVAYSVSASGYGSISGYILPATENTAVTVTLYAATVTTPATTAPDGSSTPPARDPGDVIDSGVSIVLEFFEILVFMGCIATLAGFAALMGGRRR